MDPGANFSLEVQDYTGPSQTWISNETEPGIYSIDLSQLMGWSGVHRFYATIWAGGGAGRGINLRSVSVGQGTVTKRVEFRYDPFGRRIEKNVITNGIPEVTRFTYDGAHIIQENNNKYIYSPRIDEPINISTNGQTYYYYRDRLGTITALADSSGNVVEEYHYDPFGRPLNESSTGNQFMFTAREWDSETSLYYYRARYYDPDAGRFISADPLTWAPNDPRIRRYAWYDPWYMLLVNAGSSGIDNLTEDITLSKLIQDNITNIGKFNPALLNPYTYVNNNPVNRVDPWGLEPKGPQKRDTGDVKPKPKPPKPPKTPPPKPPKYPPKPPKPWPDPLPPPQPWEPGGNDGFGPPYGPGVPGT